MQKQHRVILRFCPYGRIFAENGEERMVIGRRKVMWEIGRLLNAAGKGAVEIRVRPFNGKVFSSEEKA